jgi:hypothetical protein
VQQNQILKYEETSLAEECYNVAAIAFNPVHLAYKKAAEITY